LGESFEIAPSVKLRTGTQNAQRLGYKNDSDVIKDLFPESHSGVSGSRV